MVTRTLRLKAKDYLTHLCKAIPTRRLGSEGNQDATKFFAEIYQPFAVQIEKQPFDCMDWVDGGSKVHVEGIEFDLHTGPYSTEIFYHAPFFVARTLDELDRFDSNDFIALFAGELCQEQLMPKEFPFFNPEHHQQLIALIEKKKPAAILAATGRNPELAGGMYPFPLIEDGDFNIPNAYLKDIDGEKLAEFEGKELALTINSQRIPSKGENIIAHFGPQDGKRIVITAHIDAKDGSPGALDNGTGVVVLLLLAELLADYDGAYHIELVAFNGEDHYSAQGQKEFVKLNSDRFSSMFLNINLDAPGYKQGKTAFSHYNISSQLEQTLKEQISKNTAFMLGDPWYQGDHSIFIQQGVPAIAITSEQFMWLSTEITHTPKDDVDLVEYNTLSEIALTLQKFLLSI